MKNKELVLKSSTEPSSRECEGEPREPQRTFVSVHFAAVGDEGHFLRPAHVFVPD